MTSLRLIALLLRLSMAAQGATAVFEYSVVCPPFHSPSYPEETECDIILLAGDEPATVTIYTAEWTDTVTVQREYRWTAMESIVEGGIEQKGILISSDLPISVHLAYIDKFWSDQVYTDATGIPSVSPSQRSFHIVNHVDSPHLCAVSYRNDFFAISSTEDNTTVTITSPTSSDSFTLDLFGTFSEIPTDKDIKLSGLKVNSSAPITLISGNLCTYNFVGELARGTYITNQRPVDQYSSQFVVPAIKSSRDPGYDVHVVTSMDDTLVDIDGQLNLTQAGDIVVQTFPSRTNATLVTCSRPCNVVQFTKAYKDYDGMFAMAVTPRNGFYMHATFTTSEKNVDHHITVIVDSPTAVSDILLDGVLFDPVWSTAGDFIYGTADVIDGYHVMNSTESWFALYTYAHTRSYNHGGGYGFGVLPAEDELRPTTVSPAPTTVPSTSPGPRLPEYSITTNGTVVTEDESDVTPVCVLPYINQMEQQTNAMAATIDALIGREICINQMPGDVLIQSALGSLIFSGNQAEVYVAYNMDINQNVKISDVPECAKDIAWYVSVGEHWQDPILPGTDDCPPMDLNPNYFQLIASQWICPQTEGNQVLSDNTLLYELKVGDIMDTEDGSDLSASCTNDYTLELFRQATSLADRIQAMMDDGEMCASSQTIAEITPLSFLASMGSQVYYTVTMVTEPGPDASFGEFLECAFEVYTYVRTVSNWPDPPLPPQPGCPALITDTEMLEDRGSGWSCVDKN